MLALHIKENLLPRSNKMLPEMDTRNTGISSSERAFLKLGTTSGVSVQKKVKKIYFIGCSGHFSLSKFNSSVGSTRMLSCILQTSLFVKIFIRFRWCFLFFCWFIVMIIGFCQNGRKIVMKALFTSKNNIHKIERISDMDRNDTQQK